jgi:hypothetical protein
MFTALIWIALFSWNAWSMVDSFKTYQYKMACLNAFALGFMTLGVLVKYLS